jgi:CRP-like cAMP-binding protein
MFEKLRAYFEAHIKLSDEQFDKMKSAFIPRKMKKGEFLQREGEIARYGAFVTAGCLRSYVIDEKGREHIIQFAPENWWIGDMGSVMKNEPSRFFIEAIENSDVLLSDFVSQQRLMEQFPEYAAQYRQGIQRHTAAKDKRIIATLSATAEERYHDFLKAYPTIAQRVPQHMVASYLGLTPETISRIRKQMAKKK